jgi:putative hydrolase of the HAD superfamily
MSRSTSRRRPNAKRSIHAVIFDIGRVIVGLEPRRILAVLGPAATAGMKTSPEKVWATIQSDPLWNEWQMGRVSPRDWADHLCNLFSVSITFEQFRDAWNSVILPDPLLPDSLFARLSRKCRLVLLSNTDPLHVEYLQPRFSFYRYFPARVFSCRVGAIKPSPKIFQAAMRAAGDHPRHILYVDDVLPYVQTGLRLGLHGHQFRSHAQLESALRSYKLL